jgi:hypothetical protein
VVGAFLTVLGAAQLALVGAIFVPADWDWPILGALGVVYGVALFVAIGGIVAVADVRHARWTGIATLIAALATLVGALAWGSLFGGALLIDPTEAPRIWTLVVTDVVFAAWLILMALDSAAPKAPGLALLALLLSCRAALEVAFFLPLLGPNATSPLDQQPGDSSGAAALILGVVVLGGTVAVAAWEIVLGSRLRQSRAVVGAPAR